MSQANPFRYLPVQVELANTIRETLMRHNLWVRVLINRILYDINSEAQNIVHARLLQISDDFSAIFAEYYGEIVGKTIQETYLKYIYAIELMTQAYRANDPYTVNEQRNHLYSIAAEFARLATSINRYWDYAIIETIIREIVNTTEGQIQSLIAGNFINDAQSLENFNDQAYRLADELTHGILRQFQV